MDYVFVWNENMFHTRTCSTREHVWNLPPVHSFWPTYIHTHAARESKTERWGIYRGHCIDTHACLYSVCVFVVCVCTACVSSLYRTHTQYRERHTLYTHSMCVLYRGDTIVCAIYSCSLSLAGGRSLVCNYLCVCMCVCVCVCVITRV